MLQKVFLTLVSFFTFVAYLHAIPEVNCAGLPGCESSSDIDGAYGLIWNLIAKWIQYVAVIAVIAVMIGGIMLLLSSGDEEKTKKAKNVIIWALVGVLVSVLAWGIIGLVNNFTI